MLCRLVKMELNFRLTLAHKPDIRLGTIALIVGIKDTRNTSNHLAGSFEVFVWLLGSFVKFLFTPKGL